MHTPFLSALASRRVDAESLRRTTPEQMWLRELEALRPVLEEALQRPSPGVKQ